MLKVIIEKEIRDQLGSAKFLLAFVVCAVLTVLSFYVGASNYEAGRVRHEAAQAENLRRLEGVTDWLMVRENRVFLPPQPLASLVTGISNDIGRTTEIQGRGELAAHDSRYNEEPLFAVFRFLDLEFLFMVVLSLFAILLGYDAVSGEKERGTLRLALANAVPRPTFILGKIIGSFLSLSAGLLVAVVIGCLLLPLMGVPMTGVDWARLGLIVVCGLLYVGAFLTISIFVSTATHRSSSSFLISLVVWIVAVLIVPRASVLLAGRAVDVPSVDNIGAQKAGYASGLWADFREGMAGFSAEPGENPEKIVEALNNYMDSLTTIRDDKFNAFASRLNEERRNRSLQRQSVAFNLARISPAASLSLAAAELAGTSLSLTERYHENVLAYQKSYADFMREKTGMNVGGSMIMMKFTNDDDEEAEKTIDPTEMPAFVFQPPSLTETVQASAVDIGLLALFNLAFFAASFVAFNRYDAR